MIAGTVLLLLIFLLLFLFWRYIWFFRNPPRKSPTGENIVSPADGRVVYVKRVPPREPIISMKNHREVCVSDVVREDLTETKLLIGIFMSPFDVHYNRIPLNGEIEFVRHHPSQVKNHHMGSMHWRSLMSRLPIYENSPHILDNERTVTKIRGSFRDEPISCYVVQIAGGSVRGIESHVSRGEPVAKGQIFGLIKIGSQVDIVTTWKDSMTVKVRPGQKVRAAETVLVE
jgi:phosphatidylserine decarboxylase